MESDSKSNGNEWLIPDELFKADYLQQSHKTQRLEKINEVADITASGGAFEVKPSHLELLFGMTVQSMLDNQLIEAGETRVTYDTGEERTVRDIILKTGEVKERMFEDLHVDDQGDWAANFDERQEAIDWLTRAADTFEEKLRERFNEEEVTNG